LTRVFSPSSISAVVIPQLPRRTDSGEWGIFEMAWGIIKTEIC
jgi:hypothetical protein